MSRLAIASGAVAAVIIVGAISAAVVWRQQAALWPDLADEPPLDVPALRPQTDFWGEFSPQLDAIKNDDFYRIRDTLYVDGPPMDSGFWVLVADQMDALEPMLNAPLDTPGMKHIEDVEPHTLSLLCMGWGYGLRGWTSYESDMLTEAVDDFLRADRLGRQVIEGGQLLSTVMLGHSIQTRAMQELSEFLMLVDDPAIFARAAEGLAAQRPTPDRAMDEIFRDCHMVSQMYVLEYQNDPDAVIVDMGLDGLPRPLALLAAKQFDVDRTLAQHRRHCRTADEWRRQPVATRGAPPSHLPEGVTAGKGYNSMGSTLLDISTPFHEDAADDERAAHRQRSALQVLIAAHRYAMENGGQYPAQISDLVPGLLTEVPIDPVSLTPLVITDGAIIADGQDMHALDSLGPPVTQQAP